MADDLGARLVQAGLVTRNQVAEVRGAAPLHEGALVLGLAERGLSEDALAGFFVALGFGPLMDAGDLAAAERQALAQVPARMAHGLRALPIKHSAAGLVVAMAAPTDRHALHELSRAVGAEILPTVARVSELRAALRHAYPDAPTTDPPHLQSDRPDSEPPVLELTQIRKSGAPPGDGADGAFLGSTFLGSTKGADRVEARASLGPRVTLDDDEGFVPLVRTKPVSRPPDDPPGEASRKSDGASRPPGRSRSITANFERAQRGSAGVVAVGPANASSAPPARAEGAASRSSRPAAGAKSIIPPEHASWDLEAPENKIDPEKLRRLASRIPTRASQPASIGGSLSAMRASRDRDEVVELACHGALTVSRAAVLLALRKGVLKGWDGAGAGLSRDAVRNLWLPTSSPSMFRDVMQTGEPYVGAPGTSAADGLFRAAIGGRGGVVVLMPIGVGGKVVAVLAADDVTFGPLGVERIEILARAVGEAFERIIVQRKR